MENLLPVMEELISYCMLVIIDVSPQKFYVIPSYCSQEDRSYNIKCWTNVQSAIKKPGLTDETFKNKTQSFSP
ncbi:hypothetical protein [Sphingobacterium deserti]|uniref:Uncharacterized protein n=1 Tax=Sphingobacterium deserti TaxID=1229276 RepID=A0A0B8T596_9SPHI|nr:hypothetical protein [Sphingobacterium deserti]KGE12664.1 hypothetical protein DI53_3704 [Sphingobacterium deserti]